MEYVSFNQDTTEKLKSLHGDDSTKLNDFKYLCCYVSSTEKDIKERPGKNWAALNEMNTIWSLHITDKLNRNFFRAAVESVLIYGHIT